MPQLTPASLGDRADHRVAREGVDRRDGVLRRERGPTRAHAATKQIIEAWRSGGVAHADSVTPDISGELFATADLRGAVRSFLEIGPGKATYRGE